MTEDIAEVAGRLSERARVVMRHPCFDPKGWEPRDPTTPVIGELVSAGLLHRTDGRCGFEAFKDSFVVPTPLGLAVRQHLETTR